MKSFITLFINAIDHLSLRYYSALKGALYDYCHFDTAMDAHTLITDRGELISFIDIKGAFSWMGDSEFMEATHRLELLFNGLLEKPNHTVQWVFARSPSQTQDQLKKLLEPLKRSAERQRLNQDITDYLLDERLKVLSRYMVAEKCVLALITHTDALNKIERKSQQQEKREAIAQAKKRNVWVESFGDFAQSTFISCTRLNIIHQSALITILEKLKSKEIGLVADLLDNHTALREIRRMTHPDITNESWRPVLPGDRIPLRKKPMEQGGEDNLYYPHIGSQLFKQAVKVHGNIIQMGNDFWASTLMELPPQEPQRFDQLFSAIPKNIDWRFSLSLMGGDRKYADKLKTRKLFALIFKVTNSSNEEIAAAADHLIAIRKEGERLVGIRVNLTVRAKTKEQAILDLNLCARLLQAWGNLETSFEYGDPTDAVVSSLPGMDNKSTGQTVIVPMQESTLLCPITRPTSPWEAFGSNLWRTLDGKVFPYQPCSSLQHTWISLIYATPGSGKSILQNAQNFNLCLTPGLARLPKISILDIGPSSQGLIELLQAILPAARKHEAVHRTLKNDRHSAINPFDTPLGMRIPHTAKLGFLNNFCLVLFTEKGQEKIKPGLGELVSDLLQATYREFSDDKSPKVYVPGVERRIDELMTVHPEWFALEKNVNKRQKLSWWRITDVLCTQELWDEAALAQRNAVPLLADLTGILHTHQQLKDIHGGAGNEGLFSHLNKMVRSSISEFPILAYPTQFNTQEARVVALDLADVTGANDEYSIRGTGLMYMLGRQALVSDLYFNEDDIRDMKSPARKFHELRISRELGEIKRVCLDEFHRTSQLENVRLQIVQDMREGRKYKVDISLASQVDTDFTKTMIELATNIFICNGASGSALDRVCETFDLNNSERHALKYNVHGAGPHGASFMLKCDTKTGRFVQVLMNTLGPTELWAFASTAEDALLRKRLAQKISYFKAIQRLAHEFPTGSCKKAVEELIQKNGAAMEDVIEIILQRLIEK